MIRWVQKYIGSRTSPKATPSEAPRLYLALYARFKDPHTYHYALHISPREETRDRTICETTKFHCKNILQPTQDSVTIRWIYEAIKVNSIYDDRILIKVLLGEVNRADQAESLFEKVPVMQDKSDFNCIAWTRHALLLLSQAGIMRSGIALDWEEIQKAALEYVSMKKQQGRFDAGYDGDLSRVATFDMMLGREIFP